MWIQLFSFLCLQFSPATPLKVVIDPGHGGNDSGAVYGNAKESEIALNVAHQLKKMIDQSGQFQSSLTRSGDQNLSLTERVRMAEESKADLFISLHANASTDQRARGAEFYFQNHLPPDEDSYFLAHAENQIRAEVEKSAEPEVSKKGDVAAIVEDLKRHTKMKHSFHLSEKLLRHWGSRGSHAIRQAPFYVVSKTSVPSVLVELGFISNPQESQKLVRPEYQKEVAKKIFQGLLEYKEMVDKSATGRLQ